MRIRLNILVLIIGYFLVFINYINETEVNNNFVLTMILLIYANQIRSEH